MERKDLKAMQAYFDLTADMYFWSPDGVGGFWYESQAEMEDEHGTGFIIVVDEILDY